MKRESPDYIKLSLASAITLGFKNGLFYRDAENFCVNLLLTYDKGCIANCAYCGLSKKRVGAFNEKSFIRVDWPLIETDKIIEKLVENKSKIRRICISMITNPRAVEDSKEIVRRILNLPIPPFTKGGIQGGLYPISVLLSPTIMDRNDLIDFKNLGVDRVGVAVDAATSEIFDKLRSKGVKGPHKWDKYWQIFNDSVEVFGEKMAGVHLIVGLGETEEEMVNLIYKTTKSGGKIHLFSFFPESNSKLSDYPRPSIHSYRKIQLAAYLLNYNPPIPPFSKGGSKRGLDNFIFNDCGNIKNFNIPERTLREIIKSGLPFVTSGCPDKNGGIACNRPFANELPGEEIRNFPFIPEPSDITKIEEELQPYLSFVL